MNKDGKWSIPTTYKGIRMRSKLETEWAQWFDEYGIIWAYEPEGFALPNGIAYLPDFWLPEMNTVFEAKGVLDQDDEAKIRALAKTAAPRGVMVILGEAPVGARYRLVNPTPQRTTDEFVHLYDDMVALVRCSKCKRWYFVEAFHKWTCRTCDYYDGKYTFDAVAPKCPAGKQDSKFRPE